MSERVQIAGVNASYAFLVLFFLGFGGLAGFIPPPSPADSAAAFQQTFVDNATGIRAGMIICSFAAALTLPWAAVVSVQIKRIEGRRSPLTYLWIAAAGAFVIEFLYPFAIWMATSFRPDETPDILRHLNDLAWIALISVISSAVMQTIALGIAVFRDERATPLYPRWFAYFQFWCGLLFVPAGLIVFFKTGAFAWNGIVSFWMVVVVFAAWMIVTTVMTVRAIRVPDEPEPDLRAEVTRLAHEIAELKGVAR